MRFEDEPYIKIYTSDSVTWSMLSWQAQGLLLCLMRKLDRAGILHLKGHEPARAIASVLRWPVEVVREFLPELCEGDEPTVVITNGHLVQPRYVAGQMAKPTSTARTRAQRARQRDLSRAQALGLDPNTGQFSQDSLPSDLVQTGKNGNKGESSERVRSSGTQRPTSGRDVPDRDATSQSETARDALRHSIRSDQIVNTGGETMVVNQPPAPAPQVGAPPEKTTIPDPVPRDVAQVFAWLADAQKRLRGQSSPEVYSAATEGLVRQVLDDTGLTLDAWREAIEGQYLDLRDKPQDKWRWLSLDTLAKTRNFRQARERYLVWRAAEDAKTRHQAEQSRRGEAERKALAEAREREEAEAQAALEALDL